MILTSHLVCAVSLLQFMPPRTDKNVFPSAFILPLDACAFRDVTVMMQEVMKFERGSY